jgi:hypothetical protein
MKTILRTLIILAAAVIISGIAMVIVNHNSAAQSTLAGLPGEGLRRGRGDLDGAAPAGFPEGRMERHGEESSSLLGLSGLAKNLGIVAGIVAVYWLAEKLFGLFRSKMKLKAVGN